MNTLYNVLNLFDLSSEIEILDAEGHLLQEGNRGETDWQEQLLDIKVDLIIPGIVTKIILKHRG